MKNIHFHPPQSQGNNTHLAVLLIDVKFPNSIMYDSWYNGQLRVHDLTIAKCDLRIVRPYAFDGSAFDLLKMLTFESMVDFVFSYAASHHFNFKAMIFREIQFDYLANKMLSPFKSNLNIFAIIYMPDDVSFDDFFYHENYSKVYSFQIIGVGLSATRQITKKSLPRLPRIRDMRLARCGIERIDPNAFKYIGETLVGLDLTSNKLKTLSIRMLYTYFDSPSRHNAKILMFHNNPFECDCDLNEVKNFINLNLAYPFKFTLIECQLNDADLNCAERTQRITKEKFFYDDKHYWSTAVQFTKVNMWPSNGMLIVRTTFSPRFRLLAISHRAIRFQNDTKCPPLGWIRDSIACYLITGAETKIPLQDVLKRSDSMTFSAILTMEKKRAWPLHIKSYRNGSEPSAVAHIDKLVYLFAGLIGINCCGILYIALLLVSWCRRSKNLKRVESVAYDSVSI